MKEFSSSKLEIIMLDPDFNLAIMFPIGLFIVTMAPMLIALVFLSLKAVMRGIFR